MLRAVLPAAANADSEGGAPPPGDGTVTCRPNNSTAYNEVTLYEEVDADYTLVLEPGVRVNNIGQTDYLLVLPGDVDGHGGRAGLQLSF